MQNWGVRKTGLRLMAIVGVLAGMVTILGCPNDEQGALVAQGNAIIPITATKLRALDNALGITMTFTAGTVLGAQATPATPVLLTFTNTASPTPNFTLASQTRTATGTITFPASGQCTFNVQASSFGNAPAVPGPLAPTQTTVACTQSDQVRSILCGSPINVTATVTLVGPNTSATSVPFSVTVIIDPITGQITINGIAIPGVTVVCEPPTGGSGSGS